MKICKKEEKEKEGGEADDDDNNNNNDNNKKDFVEEGWVRGGGEVGADNNTTLEGDNTPHYTNPSTA